MKISGGGGVLVRRISNKAYTELRACTDMLFQVLKTEENVLEDDSKTQNVMVTTNAGKMSARTVNR